MARCGGFKPDGTPCERIVGASQGYCYSHDPNRSAERKRNASKAGRFRPSKDLSEAKRRLKDLAEDVLEGKVDRADAAVAGQLLGTYIRAVGVELKAREVEDILAKVEALERVAEEGDKGWAWDGA